MCSACTASINFLHPYFAFSSQTLRYQWISGFVVILNTSNFKRFRSPFPSSFLFILPSDLSFFCLPLILFSFASFYFFKSFDYNSSVAIWLPPSQLANYWELAALETASGDDNESTRHTTTPKFAPKTQEKPRTFRKINRDSKKTDKWTKENNRKLKPWLLNLDINLLRNFPPKNQFYIKFVLISRKLWP